MNFQFLSTPEFWSALIAGIALILSQFPPLSELLSRKRIRIRLPEQISLFHFLGSIHLNTFIDIRNAGAHTVAVERIVCVFTDDEGKLWRLPAQTYYPQESLSGSTSTDLLIGSIVLKPSETWQQTIRCYRLWSEAEDEKVNEIISAIRQNISDKLPKPTPDNPQPTLPGPIEADEEIVDGAMKLFAQNFGLHKGNYRLYVAALSEKDRPLVVESFHFTLFESQIKGLVAMTEDYKYGAGIYLPSHPMRHVWLRLRSDNDQKKAVEEYANLFQ